jgi:hypothetical protein
MSFHEWPPNPQTRNLYILSDIQPQTTHLPPSHPSQTDKLNHTSIALISYPRATRASNSNPQNSTTNTHIPNNGLQPFQLCRKQQLGRKAREDECTPSNDGEQVARRRRQQQRRVSFSTLHLFLLHPSTPRSKMLTHPLLLLSGNPTNAYVSPSDAIMSPASQKLSGFKQRQMNKS